MSERATIHCGAGYSGHWKPNELRQELNRRGFEPGTVERLVMTVPVVECPEPWWQRLLNRWLPYRNRSR